MYGNAATYDSGTGQDGCLFTVSTGTTVGASTLGTTGVLDGSLGTSTATTVDPALEGIAFVEFTVTADATGTIGGNYMNNGTDGGIQGNFNGFQIAPAATPEPCTMCLLALGGLAMLRRRK